MSCVGEAEQSCSKPELLLREIKALSLFTFVL